MINDSTFASSLFLNTEAQREKEYINTYMAREHGEMPRHFAECAELCTGLCVLCKQQGCSLYTLISNTI